MLNPSEKSRLKWACRRGMLEHGCDLYAAFGHEFDGLGEAEQRTFIRLLECEDPELFRWCMGLACPEDPDFCRHDPLILERNQARHDSLR